jgi:ubiquinone/menaquinone biosynthesis C-methylase UbiE
METVSTGREFYERNYHYEEDITLPDKKRIARFFENIHFTEDQLYLDIGCGAGAALNFCAQHGVQCHGFDISFRAIKLGRPSTNPDIATLVANGEKLPYRSSLFDIVSSLGSIEHFSSVERGLQETSRVTRKGGQVLLVVPNSYWLLSKLQLYKGTEQPLEMLATIGQWVRLFNRYGLSVQKIGMDFGPRIMKNHHPLGILKRALLKITIALPKSFAYQFVFVCQKR